MGRVRTTGGCFTSYKVYYLLYLIYIQHRLDNTIGKMFLDTFQNLSTLTLLLHLSRFVASFVLYNESRTHDGDSLNQFIVKTQFDEYT